MKGLRDFHQFWQLSRERLEYKKIREKSTAAPAATRAIVLQKKEAKARKGPLEPLGIHWGTMERVILKLTRIIYGVPRHIHNYSIYGVAR